MPSAPDGELTIPSRVSYAIRGLLQTPWSGKNSSPKATLFITSRALAVSWPQRQVNDSLLLARVVRWHLVPDRRIMTA